MTRRHVICCVEGVSPPWRWIEGVLADPEVSFEFIYCAPRHAFERRLRLNLARIRGAWQATCAARRSPGSALVVHHPSIAAWCGIFLRLLGVKARTLAFSFNFAALPSPLKRRVFAFALARFDGFVVNSRMERELYARLFRIDPERFDVLLWAVRPPAVSDAEIPVEQGDYVCAIGGNARDYPALVEAAKGLPDIRFVVVARPENLRNLALPPNLKLHTNIPLAAAMNILQHSKFMVLPLTGTDVPCGHVTIVAAMHLGKAFIVTDSTGVSDYARHEENALLVPVGSAVELGAAIRRLWLDPGLGRKLGEAGRIFARESCSEERTVRYFKDWLLQGPGSPMPPGR